MFATGETLEDVEAWANSKFPAEFNKVKNYLNRKTFVCSRVGGTADAPMVAVIAGATPQKLPIYLRFDSYNGELALFHKRCPSIPGPVSPTNYTSIHISSSVKSQLNEPFCWLCPDRNAVDEARLEALLHYTTLACRKPHSYNIDLITFKQNFEIACHTIAKHLELHNPQSDESQRSVLLRFKPMTPPASTVSQTINEPATPAVVSRKRTRTVEEIVTAFRGDLDEEISAAQAADRQEKEELRFQIQALEMRAVSVEQKSMKYKADVTVAEERAKKAETRANVAEEEAAKSQTQYEELRIIMNKIMDKIMDKNKVHYEELGKMFQSTQR